MASKAIRRIEEKMAEVEPGTLRFQVLQAAKQFKASWIELGKMLFSVSKEKRFREWGYLTFEAYCAQEIGIRPNTARKLVYSYTFLEREEPAFFERVKQDSPKQLPDMEAVDLLRRLKARQGISSGGYERVRSYVLEEGRDLPQVRAQVRSLLTASRPDSQEDRLSQEKAMVKRFIATFRRMRSEGQESQLIPKRMLSDMEGWIRKLEETLLK